MPLMWSEKDKGNRMGANLCVEELLEIECLSVLSQKGWCFLRSYTGNEAEHGRACN